MLEETKGRAKVRAQEEAQRQRERAKDELGAWMYEMLEDYFPEQARAQRRQDRLVMLVVGISAGILLYHFLTRRPR